MPKRALDEDEVLAEAEIAAALEAAAKAPADEEISGLGSGTAMVVFEIPGEKVKQYRSVAPKRGEKPLIFLYLCIRGLGETPRLMLAECGAAYTHLASPMGEEQAVSCEWRNRSPNGLTPVLSGLGVPRAKPLSQSSTIIRFLGKKMGMAGETELEGYYADVLFETAKDLKGKKLEIIGDTEEETNGAKGPASTAQKIALMLESMPDPKDEGAALNFGQIELLNLLLECEESKAGCVAALSPALESFRAAAAQRPRIAKYLASPLRFPAIVPGYKYAAGPVKRSAFALS